MSWWGWPLYELDDLDGVWLLDIDEVVVILVLWEILVGVVSVEGDDGGVVVHGYGEESWVR